MAALSYGGPYIMAGSQVAPYQYNMTKKFIASYAYIKVHCLECVVYFLVLLCMLMLFTRAMQPDNV